MKDKTIPFYFVAALFTLFLLYLVYKIFAPFLQAFFWAVVFSVAFYPFYLFIHSKIRHAGIASAIVVLISFLLIIGPISYVSFLLVHELKGLVRHLSLEEGSGMLLKKEDLMPFADKVASILNLNSSDVYETALGFIEGVKRSALRVINEHVFTVVHAIIDYFIMLFTMFFLLRDGRVFIENIGQYLPMTDEQKRAMIVRGKEVIVATLYGGVFMAFVHGIVGGVSFYFLGVASPVLLGFLMFLLSFIPVLGAFSVWGPVTAYFLLSGFVIKGVIMLAIGLLVLVGIVDHVLKPKIIGAKAKIHTLLIFFGVLGGLRLFGIIGFIAGPLIIALLQLILEMVDQRLKGLSQS
ncbi:MAG TPA: AI-2E family transporter [Thermodesulfovibrionales bacterium]|nr:AI-2E family transporter [Thermodesulfovibrionales bacterium]